MPTPYSPSNQAFSDVAHKAAQSLIYPFVFKTEQSNLAFESTSLSTSPKNAILDGEMATDRIVKVTVKTLRHPLQFTVQERFRKPEYAKFQDITITEWNCATNLPSELYKLNSGMFVYGYFDQHIDTFVDWVTFNTVGLLHQFATAGKAFRIQNNPRSNQDFYAVTFAFLQSNGLIIARKIVPPQQTKPQQGQIF